MTYNDFSTRTAKNYLLKLGKLEENEIYSIVLHDTQETFHQIDQEIEDSVESINFSNRRHAALWNAMSRLENRLAALSNSSKVSRESLDMMRIQLQRIKKKIKTLDKASKGL